MSSSSIYFRNFDRLEADGQLDEAIVAEFPQAAETLKDGVSRRRWLQLMGASIALGTAAGCRYQQSFIAPYSFRPKNRMPGVPVQYATTMEFAGVGRPLLATSFDGRPIKLDGNPDFYAEGGGSDVRVQATVLELYDPDRSRHPIKSEGGKRVEHSWSDLQAEVASWLSNSDGNGVLFLVEPTSSPTFERLKKVVQNTYPQSRWFEYASINDDNERAATRQSFGSAYTPVYQLDRAKVVVSIDADMLGTHPFSVSNSKKWVAGRDADNQKMSRLYVAESQLSLTGSLADHRIALRPSKIAGFVAELEAEIDRRLQDNSAPIPAEGEVDRSVRTLQAMAHDLVSNKGAGCIAVGEAHGPEIHSAAYRINDKLDNFGEGGVISFVEPVNSKRELVSKQIAEFKQAISDGIESLIIIGGNPVYDGPAELGLGEAIASVKRSVHLSLYDNETSRKCIWHGNLAHPLESWGDSRAFDGTPCIAQPLIAPLHDGKSVLEIMSWMAGLKNSTQTDGESKQGSKTAPQAATLVLGERTVVVPGEALVRETAKEYLGSSSDADWQATVHRGFAENASRYVNVVFANPEALQKSERNWSEKWDGGEIEIRFVPCTKLYDGRFANSGWLQELPDPITKLTWDNAAVISPTTAEKLKLQNNRRANLNVGGESVQLPIFKVPGMPEGVIVVALGYGRTAAGRVGGDEEKGIGSRGVDVGVLRNLESGWYWASGVEVIGSKTWYELATTQEHFDMLGDFGQNEINNRTPQLIREGTYQSYLEFMEHSHSNATENHKNGDGNGDAKNGHTQNKREDMMTPVIFKKDEQSHEHGAGHHEQWPEGFHHHFENKSLGPGYLRTLEPSEYGYVDNPKWGMSIDLNNCTGCGACTIACQAENNIPIVGPEQVKKGRELHWIRVDRYFRTNVGDDQEDDGLENSEVVFQPVTCQQCENAPCEEVCPVAATTHSDEGLNDMVYNRCIGTRYCGNNCPYKVRRFNYLNFSDDVNLTNQFVKLYHGAVKMSPADRALQALVRNPEVTVRTRGVMEKCTFCIQRIQSAKIAVKNSAGKNGEIPVNSIKTACQEACPTQAIKFGNLANAKSDVAKAHANKRSYVLLEELNNHPRNKYLARVRNPHPALARKVPIESYPERH
jgi:Fe-S-cluster-containing dehydrogenase component/anaerobic selenocysteine-containing dehydrogenase